MKSVKKIFLFLSVIFAFISAFAFVSCYEPSPLYGKWADDYGSAET